MEWKTIDSAPKDGQEILVCDTRCGSVVQLFYWNSIHKAWQSKGEFVPDILKHWTHWTPITNKPRRAK